MDTIHLPESMIQAEKMYPVTVVGIAQHGIIVQLDDTQYTAFIHISKISRGFCNDPCDYVAIGDKYIAKGSTKGKKPELILTHLNLLSKNQTESITDEKPKTNKDVAKRIEPTAPVYGLKQHIPKSLDSMIEDANRTYKDKFSNKDKKQRPRRRNIRNSYKSYE